MSDQSEPKPRRRLADPCPCCNVAELLPVKDANPICVRCTGCGASWEFNGRQFEWADYVACQSQVCLNRLEFNGRRFEWADYGNPNFEAADPPQGRL
jgi:hypothetical protein